MTDEFTPIKDRYQVGRLIGCGGMGDVYIGTDLLTGDQVAIKKLRSELTSNMPQLVERFMREGEALRRLNHPNIVKVLDTVDEGTQHYIIMEFVGGGSLADMIVKDPQLPVPRVVSISLELCDALSRAHHLHILHRDIKPANILIAEDGTPRLTDFGIARFEQLPHLTETGLILGTLSYISPESLDGREVNERSDIWSLGVVMFEMLTGILPFNGSSPLEMIWAIKNQPLPIIENLRHGVPPSLAGLIRRMLRKDNPARIDSVRQVGAELEIINKEMENQVTEPNGTPSPGEKPAPIISILIIDDHAVVRQGLRMFIDLQDDMQVVGEGTNGSEAVELASQLKPDIVLLDLVMPILDGVGATARIKAVSPETRVIILTSFGEDDKVLPAIQAGAHGYLLKDIRPDELVQAVRDTYRGKTQLHPEIAQKLMSFVAGKSRPRKKPEDQ